MPPSSRAPPSRSFGCAHTLFALGLLVLSPWAAGVSALELKSATYEYPAQDQNQVDGLQPGQYPHTFALFGPNPLTYDVSGDVFYAPLYPLFCSAPPDILDAAKDKIVLAERNLPGTPGGCTFEERARLAEVAGAKALIIADYNIGTKFSIPWMAPHESPPSVSIPTIFITGATMRLILYGDSPPDNPVAPVPWISTKATINRIGLFATLDDWERSQRESSLRVFLNLSPFLMVLLCYWAWYKSTPRTVAQPRAQQPAAEEAQPAAPAAAAEQLPAVPPGGILDNPPSPSFGPSQARRTPQPSGFSEQEMVSMSLPRPPHLSGDPLGGGDAADSTDVAVEITSPRGVERDRGNSNFDEVDSKENEGLMAPGVISSSSSASSSASHSSRSVRDSVSISINENHSQQLGRSLLSTPTAHVSTWMRAYYHTLKALSTAGKPTSVFRFNAAVYLVHVVCVLYVLVKGWHERCVDEQLVMVSLWGARALIGLRICYWQCRSSSSPVPTCGDIFFKNWADCIFIFTGNIFTQRDQDTLECRLNAPTIFAATRAWTVCIYITYGLRVAFYLADKYSQRHSATLPHLVTILPRSLLTILNGGFSCAGPLDKNQPATQLDLMLIPTATFRPGMYPPDDAVCGVCLGDYTEGEVLRVLACSHHFHQSCVDTWLLQKSTCPSCRQPIDSARNSRREEADQPYDASPPVARPAHSGGIVDVDEEHMRDVERAASHSSERPPSPSRTGASHYVEPPPL